MFNYKQTLEAMKEDRASVQEELEKLDRAISALSSVVDGAVRTKATPPKRGQPISQARKQQSAKVKEAQNNKGSQSTKPKPKISAQGLRNIVAAQKKRWAKVKAAAKGKAKVAEAPRSK